MTDPKDAIARYLHEDLTDAQLMRALAAHDGWIAPAARDGDSVALRLVNMARDGAVARPTLCLFSDEAALALALAAAPGAFGGDALRALSGWRVWAELGPQVRAVSVNPFSPDGLHFGPERLDGLREWAEALGVEAALATAGETGDGLDVIRDFGRYYVVMLEGTHLALAPDARRRRFGAVFTATDALGAFLRRSRAADAQPLCLPGGALFAMLQTMSLDGIVFNSAGPGPARAFSLDFTRVVAGA